jgi:hypothetical protein
LYDFRDVRDDEEDPSPPVDDDRLLILPDNEEEEEEDDEVDDDRLSALSPFPCLRCRFLLVSSKSSDSGFRPSLFPPSQPAPEEDEEMETCIIDDSM